MFETLKKLLTQHDQQHLLAHWPRLSPAEREQLAAQIRDIDFPRIAKLAKGESKSEDWGALSARAKSPRAIRLQGTKEFSPADARRRGAEALRAGEVGAVLVAGGQGTRLGFDHPKGMYPIGPVSECPLFQILFEKLIAVGRRYGVRIPLFLMTSPATHAETIEFLDQHDRFGLAVDDLVVFCQGTMPAVDERTGNLLLASPSELALSPDGHGGLLAALGRSAAPKIIRERGIKHLFYFQVDNPLVAMCDPEFLGYHLLAGSQASTQVVAKLDPAERVGVVAEIDGRAQIIEYSDLPASEAARRGPDGSLELWAGNTAVHVFDAEFLLRMSSGDGQLPFHVARKKVPHIDASGQEIEPQEPNALKFERFIFDLLPAAKQTIVVEVDPAEAFAPLKNAAGSKTDSPELCRAAISAQHRRRLREAGFEIGDDVPVEISPLYALDAADLKTKLKPGTKFELPTHLH
ncbi:MAG: UDPGP type 1 family protein [Planctomycetia bacterium]|nr:UDPGP type 1 family protein [Planctomycetia bacterium]